HWANIEKLFTKKFLLPWARKNAYKRAWIKRNRCIRIFLLHTEKPDRPLILEKLQDKDFFIRMIAVEAIGELRERDLIAILLKRMAQEPPSCRYIYRNVLLGISFADSDEIKRVYQETNDEQLRLCCLDIFSYKFYGNIHNLLRKDLFSSNVEIRGKVIRILCNIASEEAVDDLMGQLQEEQPLFRTEAIKALGTIRNEKAFDKLIPMLHDQNYAVRLAAAQALLQYKQKGRQVLERQDWDLDPLAYEIARYVLTN
ncbi:MAG: HEAT repeat domain-containing protein, partial [Chlamydiales bacterium]